MKKCKVYSTKKNAEAEGVIIDGHVLLPAPRRDDVAPTHIADGQCYYPPLYAVAFAEGMHFDLLPFSLACAWGEYNNGEESKVREWFAYHCANGDEYDIKCGYCDTKTGKIRIPPEMEYCGDFNAHGAAIFGAEVGSVEYHLRQSVSQETAERWARIRDGDYSGLIDTSGEIISQRGYVGIEETHHGAFFVYQTADGWGVVDSKGHEILDPLYDGLSWDGLGGLTVKSYDKEGNISYGIINLGYYGLVTEGLTCEPTTIYDFPPEKRRENASVERYAHIERFRLTQKGDKYGLVRDILEDPDKPLETCSEEVLAPIYDYAKLPDEAYNVWVDTETRYYAKVIEKTPRILPGRVGDGWDTVPADIRKAVREFMEIRGVKQPETLDDVDNKW